MASILSQISRALREHLTEALTGPDGSRVDVMSYQDGAARAEDGPFVMLVVGEWHQVEVGEGEPGGRTWYRTYDVEVSCVADTTKATVLDAVNDLGDRVMQACVAFDDIAGIRLQDLRWDVGQYRPHSSHEGTGGLLALPGTASVLLNERDLTVAGGGNAIPAPFVPFPR